MARPPKRVHPERDRTDRSLTNERDKTDDELEKRGARLEEDADDVVAGARRRADDVLGRARERADLKLAQSGKDRGERARIDAERAREDAVVRTERATADAVRVSERDARRRALTALLVLEREQTDRDLLVERDRLDELITSRDDFLAIVSHDIRNMLGSLALSATALLRRSDPLGRDEIDHQARRIQRYVGRMSRLVGDLLDVVSIEAGRLSVAPERHDALDLVRETMDVFRPLANAKKVTIGSDVRAGSLLARYDYERILQVLTNLVGNALKFTPEGGGIDLVVEAVGDDVQFAVTDSGKGIDADKVAAIFERFWQADQTHRTGLGLGLFISKCIVEAHGGRIWAESRPGVGSTFYFTLPSASGATSPPDDAKA